MANFWSDPVLQPKRKSRFILNLGGLDVWVVKRVKKPSFEINESEHIFLNHKFYYPGTVSWSEVDCTLVDPLTPDAALTMYVALERSGYNLPVSQGAATVSTVSKAAAVTALGAVNIKQVSAGNEVIENFKLHNAWIKNVDFGELDYTVDDLSEITLTLRYDFAEMMDVGTQPANL